MRGHRAWFWRFTDLVVGRLHRGATDIGKVEDPGGDPRTVGDLVGEIDQELADLACWGAVLSHKLQATHDKARSLAVTADLAERLEEAGRKLFAIAQILDTESDTQAACADITRVINGTQR
jgi:hypothetical protein